MATYNAQPNIGTYDFVPYQLPMQQIATAIAARTQYWMEGASQIRGAYEQAANLQLSHEKSKNKLKDFMIEANKQLKEVAKTDLSLSENVAAAKNIFKPLYQDASLVLDDQITSFYRQQEALAERLKIQNGGKEYNLNNHNYMRDKYNEFLSDDNVDNWQEHFNKRQGYTPYYDPMPEIMDIIKSCRPNSVEGSTIDGMYIKSSKVESLMDSKLAGCLEQGLSDKARTQLKIDGYMAFGKNYELVGRSYFDLATKEEQNYGTLRNAAQGQLDALRDKEKAGTITEKERATLEELSIKVSEYNARLTDAQKEREAIAKWDIDYLKNNYERLSGALYLNQRIKGVAQYFQFSKQSDKIEENNAAMLVYKTGAMFILEQQKQLNRIALLEYENRLKNPPFDPTKLPNANPIITEDNVTNEARKVYDQRLEDALNNKRNADDYIFNEFSSQYPQYRTAEELIGSEEFQNYLMTNPDDYRVKQWLQTNYEAANEVAILSAIRQDVEERLRREKPELFNVSGISPIEAETSSGRITITPDMVIQAYAGTHPDLKVVTKTETLTDLDSDMVRTTITVPYRTLQYKGEELRDGNARGVSAKYVRPVRDLVERVGYKVSNIDKEADKYYSEAFLTSENIKNISSLNTPDNNFRMSLASILGINNKTDMNDVIFLQQTDSVGGVWVDFVETDKVKLPKDTIQRLINQFGSENVKKVKELNDRKGVRYFINNVPDFKYVERDDFTRKMYTTINAQIKVNEPRLNRGEVLDIPLMGRSDVSSNSATPSFKLTVRPGMAKAVNGVNVNTRVMEVYVKPKGTQNYQRAFSVNSVEEAIAKINKLDNERLSNAR